MPPAVDNVLAWAKQNPVLAGGLLIGAGVVGYLAMRSMGSGEPATAEGFPPAVDLSGAEGAPISTAPIPEIPDLPSAPTRTRKNRTGITKLGTIISSAVPAVISSPPGPGYFYGVGNLAVDPTLLDRERLAPAAPGVWAVLSPSGERTQAAHKPPEKKKTPRSRVVRSTGIQKMRQRFLYQLRPWYSRDVRPGGIGH